MRENPSGPPTLRILAWELTRQCNLRCLHCRASATPDPWKDELTTKEAFALLESLARGDKPVVILTGGEPMARADVYDLARRGTDLGLRMVMAPCGALLDSHAVVRLIDSGIQRISLSIDGAEAATHDAFRGVKGSFDQVIAAARAAKEGGLPFQINTTVTSRNLDELPAIVDLAQRIGSAAFHPFLLVPTGRAREMAGLEVPAERYEEVLRWLIRESPAWGLPVKATCAPHYQRLLLQDGKAGASPGHPGSAMDRMTGGCLGGKSFAFVSWRGDVQICGFLDISAGSLRDVDMDFSRIWTESPFLKEIRDPDQYKGRCGACEFRKLCSGCRARAYACLGDQLAEDPACSWVPASLRRGRPPATGGGKV